MDWFISSFSSVSFCCMYFEAVLHIHLEFLYLPNMLIFYYYDLYPFASSDSPCWCLFCLLIQTLLSYAYYLHDLSLSRNLFTANLFTALYFKCISLKQHTVGSCWDAKSIFLSVPALFSASASPVFLHLRGVYLHTLVPPPAADCFCLLLSACLSGGRGPKGGSSSNLR